MFVRKRKKRMSVYEELKRWALSYTLFLLSISILCSGGWVIYFGFQETSDRMHYGSIWGVAFVISLGLLICFKLYEDRRPLPIKVRRCLWFMILVYFVAIVLLIVGILIAGGGLTAMASPVIAFGSAIMFIPPLLRLLLYER